MRTRIAKGIVGLVGCMLVLGCGSINGTDYQGESLMHLGGQISLSESTLVTAGKDFHVGLLWMFLKANEHDSGGKMQDSVVGASFPARFELDLFSDPADDAIMGYDDIARSYGSFKNIPLVGGLLEGVEFEQLFPKDTRIGPALIVVWEDTNGNGKFDFEIRETADTAKGYVLDALKNGGPDRIVGGAPMHGVFFQKGQGLTDLFYQKVREFTEMAGDNFLIHFEDGETLPIGYSLGEVTGSQVFMPMGLIDQYRIVSKDTEVPIVISDNFCNCFPIIEGIQQELCQGQ